VDLGQHLPTGAGKPHVDRLAAVPQRVRDQFRDDEFDEIGVLGQPPACHGLPGVTAGAARLSRIPPEWADDGRFAGQGQGHR
jgi:hypothetical protein